MIIALIGLFVIPFISLPKDSFASKMYNSCCSTNYLFYLMPLIILAFIISGAILIIAVFSKKIILKKNTIVSKNAFSTREIAFDEIKGFAVNHFVLYIEANSKDKKRITINLLSLNRGDKLLQYLEKRFVNLDFIMAEEIL
ncbi:hypothetical protein [Flavobacterium mesophilum]|uniref:hypothetical protein n=1 Tax=Flavobacterium mesophilum TaxID=3143495 RepID=UPI0031E08F72